MDGNIESKMQGLISAYLEAKKSGKLGEETYYGERMERYREWQRTNILDYDKLTGYSDEDFVQIFGEMFDNSDGSVSSHNLARGMHFKTAEKRLTVRQQFEGLIRYIIDPNNDRFKLLEEVLDTSSPYKVPGLGSHSLTTLINSQYPDVPPVNGTTKAFFRNIGLSFPSKLPEQQRAACQFFAEMVALSGGTLTLDDVNLICWFSKEIESGANYMRQAFPDTFEKRLRKKSTNKKPADKNKINSGDIVNREIRGW